MFFAKAHLEQLTSQGPCPTRFPLRLAEVPQGWGAQATRSESQVRVERRHFVLTCNESHTDVELQDAGAEGS